MLRQINARLKIMSMVSGRFIRPLILLIDRTLMILHQSAWLVEILAITVKRARINERRSYRHYYGRAVEQAKGKDKKMDQEQINDIMEKGMKPYQRRQALAGRGDNTHLLDACIQAMKHAVEWIEDDRFGEEYISENWYWEMKNLLGGL